MTTPQRMIKFLHHPRTGGTYIKDVAAKNGVRFYGRHYLDINFGDGCYYMTTLRRPVDRVVSYLRLFWHMAPRRFDWYDEAVGAAHCGRFVESGWRDIGWVKKTNSMEVNNAICCRLAGHDRFGASTYDAAVEHLNLFDRVCFFEDYAGVLDALGGLSGKQISISGDETKNSSIDIGYTFGDDDISWIIENNQADSNLYNYAYSKYL